MDIIHRERFSEATQPYNITISTIRKKPERHWKENPLRTPARIRLPFTPHALVLNIWYSGLCIELWIWWIILTYISNTRLREYETRKRVWWLNSAKCQEDSEVIPNGELGNSHLTDTRPAHTRLEKHAWLVCCIWAVSTYMVKALELHPRTITKTKTRNRIMHSQK